MAKKATQAVKDIEVAPQVIEAKEAAKPAAKVSTPKKPQWEIKDRTYLLNGLKTPLTYTIASRHTSRYPLLWFDKEKNEQRELRYATNQNSPLVDEQSGEATLGHIVFRDGTLTVTKEKQKDDLETIEYIIEALNVARDMDIDQAEAILRVEVGSKVSDMSSKEIKRDLLIFAKENAQLFLELANDENVQLRNVAINATELGLLDLSQDQRTFAWAKTGRKIMNVPFDENPYSAMAAFFKTDEGIEVYKSIEKKLL